MRSTTRKRAGRLLSLLTAICMMWMMVLPVMAEGVEPEYTLEPRSLSPEPIQISTIAEGDNTNAGNTGLLTATNDPRESVMQISLGYEDDAGNFYDFKWGTCFLINDEYVLTNKHVITMDNDEFQDFKTLFNVPNLAPNDSHIKIYLYVNRDMRVAATMHDSVNSDDLDFAAVKLAEKIYDRKPVALGDSDQIEVKDQVYAMGYPSDSISNKEYNTKDDVSSVVGNISKATTADVDIIEHTATLNNGNSGGPLMDENDNVIGINSFIAGKKNYSIQINAVRKGLDTFGITYVPGGEVIPDPPVPPEPVDNSVILADLQATIEEAKALAKDAKKYTEESVAKLNDEIGAAETVYAKGDDAEATEINSATSRLKDAMKLEEKSGPNMILIGGIIAAVVIIIIIIIVIVISSSKKKKSAKAKPPVGPSGYPGGMSSPAGAGGPSMPSPTATSTSMPEGAGETTLLDAGAGETTLLGGGAGSAYLIRKKNGEKIMINLQNFKIGKEKKKVNYCVMDNTTVSRLHCEIIKKGADYYVADMGSANGTFVNGVQASPHKEMLLSNQSVLKLSDEEFEFHLS